LSSQSECKIIKRTSNQLELGFFDNLVRFQLDGKAIGRIHSWSTMNDNENIVDCKLIYSTDGKKRIVFNVNDSKYIMNL
jgi:hypothetical protein